MLSQCSGNVTAIRGGGCETEKVVERLVYLETLKFEGLAPIKKETGKRKKANKFKGALVSGTVLFLCRL